tara:strand:- start:56 stop:781 length:726 start_codon:yes stop_codon:yes gene_type:complete
MFMKTNNIQFDYRDKRVIVFGGSRGIGREVCEQFALTGAEVHSISRSQCDFVSQVTSHQCDISNPDDIHRVFSTVGDVDFVINVAGTNLCEPIENIELKEWDRLMETNLRSFFVICKKAVESMRSSGGRIVNVSSIAGRSKSIVSGVHYTSSKYGIVGLTKQLAHEVSQYNILVNCVCPSQTLTEMLSESMTPEQLQELSARIPIRRIATTAEQALPILFLCSDAASYITGATVDVNGGQF